MRRPYKQHLIEIKKLRRKLGIKDKEMPVSMQQAIEWIKTMQNQIGGV